MNSLRYILVCALCSCLVHAGMANDSIRIHDFELSAGAALTGLRTNDWTPSGSTAVLGVIDFAWQYRQGNNLWGVSLNTAFGQEYFTTISDPPRPSQQGHAQLDMHWLRRIPVKTRSVNIWLGLYGRTETIIQYPILYQLFDYYSYLLTRPDYRIENSIGIALQTEYVFRNLSLTAALDLPLLMFGRFEYKDMPYGDFVNFRKENIMRAAWKCISPNTVAGIWNYTHPIAQVKIAYCVKTSPTMRTYLHIYYEPQYLYYNNHSAYTEYLRHSIGIGCTFRLNGAE